MVRESSEYEVKCVKIFKKKRKKRKKPTQSLFLVFFGVDTLLNILDVKNTGGKAIFHTKHKVLHVVPL
jgi:hypothetical protein